MVGEASPAADTAGVGRSAHLIEFAKKRPMMRKDSSVGRLPGPQKYVK